MSSTTARRRVLKVPVDGVAEHRAELLAAEEPLEIRVDGEPLTVTMRTPGDDIDLAAGFLFTEGLLRRLDAVHEIRMCDDNPGCRTGSGRPSGCSAGPEGCTRPACSAPTARCSCCARTWAGTTRWTRWPGGRCATAGCRWPVTCCWSAAGPRSS